MRTLSIAVVVIGVLLAAPSADALDVVAVTLNGTHRPYAPETYVNVNGEGTDVVGLRVAGDRLLVTGAGGVHPREECRAVSDVEASCPVGGVKVRLGPGDDSLDATALPAARLLDADGEDGDDVLLGGPGAERLVGGPGDDRLDGGDGGDSLEGGAGSDAVSGGAGDDGIDQETAGGAADAIDGGRGRDQLSELGPGPLRVDLAAGTSVAPSGTATLAGVEAVSGTPADDVLLGGDGPDGLTAGGGSDLLDGRAGDDVLTAEGPDTLIGGDGADRLDDVVGQARLDGGPGDDLLGGPLDADDACGSGVDRVTAGPRVAVRLACERRLVGMADVWLELPLTVPAGAARLRVVVQPTVSYARGKWVRLAVGRRGRPVTVRPSTRSARVVRLALRGRRSPNRIRLRVTVRPAATSGLEATRGSFVVLVAR